MTRTVGELTYTEDLKGLTCWCGTGMGVAASLYKLHLEQRTPEELYCPLGHTVIFGQESEVEQLRKQLKSADARIQHERDQREATERSLAATRGHLTRIRKRVSQGVCPWCNRSFQNVRRHVGSKHPDHLSELDEATT